MNFKSLLGNFGFFGKGAGTQSGDGNLETQKAAFIDPVFDQRDPREALLHRSWKAYLDAKRGGRAQADVALHTFLEVFEKTFQDWRPDESIFTDDKQVMSWSRSAGVSQGGEPGLWVQGCKGGHPREVLAAISEALEEIPAMLGQVELSSNEPDSNSRPPAASFRISEAAVLAFRSHHNCDVLVGLGVLDRIHRIMKVAVSKLNAMAARFAVHDDSASAQLTSLQFQLAQAASMICAFVGAESSHAGCKPYMQPYVRDSAISCCTTMSQPVSRSEAEAADRALQPLLSRGFLPLLLDIHRLLALLRSKAAPMAARAEELVLEAVLGIVSASARGTSSLKARERDQSGLLALLKHLGPEEEAAESQAVEGTKTRLVLELRAQIRVLQTIGAAVKRNKSNLQLFDEAGGFDRVRQLLLWTAVSFQTAAAPHSAPKPQWPGPPTWTSASADTQPGLSAAERSSAVASTSGREPKSSLKSSKPSRRKSVRFEESEENAPRTLGRVRVRTSQGVQEELELGLPAASAGKSVLQNQELSEVFCVLESWLSLKEARSSGRQEAEHRERLCSGLCQAVCACFGEGSGPYRVLSDHVTLQHYSLAFFSHLLESAPASLETLRGLGYLDLLFGRSFFFHGEAELRGRAPLEVLASRFQPGVMSQQPQRQSLGTSQDARIGMKLTEDPTSGQLRVHLSVTGTEDPDAGHLNAMLQDQGPEAPRANREALRALRRRVIYLVEQAACSQGGSGNAPECSQLLGLLSDRVLEPEVVLAAAPALSRIVLARREAALETLEQLEALPILSRGVKCQQHSGLPSKAGGCTDEGGEPRSMEASEVFEAARFALLRLLASLLQSSTGMQRLAVRTWDTVAAVFGLLHEAATRQVALRMVVGLMQMVPEREDDALAKTALFTKYIEVLPTALQDWRDQGLGMAFDLLAGIQAVVRANQQQHQNLFRGAECFVQIVNLLNLDYPLDLGTQLCCHVFRTLTALLAGNEASRNKFREDVGYDTLFSIVTRLTGAQGASQELLLLMLSFALEHEYEEGAPGQQLLNTHAVGLVFRCMRSSSQPVQQRMLRVWQGLVGGNMANLAACERSNVNGLLIEWLQQTTESPALQFEIARLLQLTGAFSITGRDLRAFFGLLKPTASSTAPRHSPLLLRTLAVMARHEGPAAFFDFANDTAGLIRHSPLKFPGSRGYTFATWLRLEKVVLNPTAGGQSLFCLLSKSGGTCKAVAAALQGDKLVMYCLLPKLAEVTLNFNFEPKRWYHVVVTHSSGGPLTPSTVRLFVDGEQVSGTRFKFPKVTDPGSECSIGARMSAQETGLGFPLCAFSGQMGCIYLFEDILSEAQISAVHDLGPDYQSTFMATESDPAFEQAANAASVVVRGKEALAPVLLMSYNAQAAAGRMLYDTSDMNRGGGEEGGTAAMLEGTQLCCTCQLRDILHCLGGVAILLPLLAQLDFAAEEEAEVVGSRAVAVVRLFCAILDDSPSNRQSMVQISGVALMSQLLQQARPEHLSVDLLKALEGLCRASRPVEELWQDVLHRLLLNIKLWARADVLTQRHLLQFLVNMAKAQPGTFRKFLGVPQVLDGVRAHYWSHSSPDSMRLAGGGGSAAAAAAGELRELRRGLLHIARILLRQSVQPGNWHLKSSWADVQAFISFVGDCPDVEMLEDVLSALLEAMHRGSPSHRFLVACIRSHGGERLFMSLLQREQQSLRLLGLQLLTAFEGPSAAGAQGRGVEPGDQTASGQPASGLDNMKRRGFWTSVTDLILMFPLTQPVRMVLLEMLCVGSQPSQVTGAQAVPQISCPPVFGILLRLLQSCEEPQERLQTLEALHHLCVDGPKENRASLVEQPGWESWFLELLLDNSAVMRKAARPGSRQSSRADSWAAGAREPAGPEGVPARLTADNLAEMRRASFGSANTGSIESGVSRRDSELGLPAGSWSWSSEETKLLKGMLQALHLHCIQNIPEGFRTLERTAAKLRVHTDHGLVDGWGLMHSLLADVVRTLLGSSQHDSASVTADAWMMVSSLAVSPCRENTLGVLGLIDQLASGALLSPESGNLNPGQAAVAWCEQSGPEEVPPFIWASIGLSEAAEKHLTPTVWQLYDSTWQLVYVLHQAMQGLAALGALGEPGGGAKPSSLPAAAGRGTPSQSSLPFGLDRKIAALPVVGRSFGEGAKVAEADVGLADAVVQQSVRLILRLLLKYLAHASLANAESCAGNAANLLPLLLDASAPAARGQFHLLLGALSHALSALSGKGDAERERLLCRTVQALVQSGEKIYAADRVPLPQLPPLEDPQFKLVAEGTLQGARIAAAARSEVQALKRAAEEREQAQQLLGAQSATRLVQERQLRQNLQEDARQALTLIQSSERSRRQAARSAADEEAQVLTRHWRNIWRSLSEAGGIWSDKEGSEDLHWKLDKFEDPSRRRPKLRRNYKFRMYQQPSKGGSSPPGEPTPEPLALPGVKRRTQSEDEEALPPSESASPEKPAGGDRDEARTPDQAARDQDQLSAEEEARQDPAVPEDDLQKVLYSTACLLVSPKQVLPGTLQITPTQLHFSGDFSGEAGQGSPEKTKVGRRQYKRWPIAAMVEAHHMRFLLRPFAVEIFLADRTNALFSLPTAQVAKEVTRHLHGISSSIVVFDRKKKQDTAMKLQQKWQRWEISNFDYLMQLNLLAGRTYNDLNQYPVFPWVIADYSSETLDLNTAATFRDLSKPVGALDEKRLAFFRERYDGLKLDPDTPPFHYGSHYSSAGIVLFYLVRMEPFTLLNRNLQGGRFDHADRLFHSIPETWQNSLLNSTDVKELTPEFFYQPEFLLNSNGFALGQRQDGHQLSDVALPPWAHGSADEFVRLQREALESSFVSEHLHDWLDLIFGVKQQGRAAEEACNVFYYLTYEGAVDLDDIADPLQRKAVEDQISFFGQTPSQLFRRKHGKRGAPPAPAGHPLLNAPEAMKLIIVGKPPTRRPNISVAELAVSDGRVVLINADRAVSCHRWLSPKDLPAFTFSGMGDNGYSVEADAAAPRLLGTPFAADLDCGKCYCVLPGGQVIVSCGYWDNSIRCYSVDEGRLLQSVRQHKDIVTCIALGSDGCTLVSGSRDTTVIIWDTIGAQRPSRSRGRTQPAFLPMRAQPRHVLYGHSDAVTCVALSPDLDLVISASADGSMLFHTLSTGRHVRTLYLPGKLPVGMLAVAPQLGMLIAHSPEDLGLHCFTANGRHVVSAEGSERLASMAVSPDGRFILTGGAKGLVTLRWLHSLQVVLRYDAQRGPVTALTVTQEECVLAGTIDGSLLVFAPDPRRTISKRLDVADARPAGSVSVPLGPVATLKFDC